MATAYAHGLYEPLPENLFEVKFDFDPTLVFFCLVLLAYLYGWESFRGRKPLPRWQFVSFLCGLTVNILALVPPIDPLSDRLFFMHMIQHVMIVSIGVPLMLLGSPYYVIVRGMHPWLRKKVYLPLLRQKWLHKINGGKDQDPNNVNKVPIQAGHFDHIRIEPLIPFDQGSD